ncbi:hypothetical protein [Kitasatospora sp. NPDC059571]|uniref:hypothetical protein n=1 Tax=Kitasatospora sp. NPDC059571 TaxID=3346871 RepID=UPI003683E4F0
MRKKLVGLVTALAATLAITGAVVVQTVQDQARAAAVTVASGDPIPSVVAESGDPIPSVLPKG